jgi:3',5'-cyclic AMP phosphodiesterase CpdA
MFDGTGQNSSRRQFLKASLAAAAGVATLGPRVCLSEQSNDVAHWAFLSDTHIAADPDNRYRGFYPYQNLRHITDQLTGNLPDGLVVAGDLARLNGRPGDYENLRRLLDPIADRRSIRLATGNHDNRDNFLRTFERSRDRAWSVRGKHIVTVRSGPVRLIILDSLLFIDLPWGRLGRAQRAWLDTYLRVSDDTPTILVLHHPVGGHDSLLDGRTFWNLIKPVAKVKAVVHGHSHVFGIAEYDGIHLISLPATGYNAFDRDPVGWMDAHLTRDYGDFFLHAIDGNTRLNGTARRLRWRT